MNSLITEPFPVAFYTWLLCVLWAEITPFWGRQLKRGDSAISGNQVIIQLDLQFPASDVKLWWLLLLAALSKSCAELGLGYTAECGFSVWFLLCICRVLESLLVSLTTTVVVFVASMVLGECRQMSSTSHSGNDTLSLQVRDLMWRLHVSIILFILQRSTGT